VLTEYPLRSIIDNPEATRQITKWAAELNPYDIKYEPTVAINGQVVAYFIAEFTLGALTQSDPREGCFLNVDGASNCKGQASGSSSPPLRIPSSNNPSYSASLP